MIRLSHILKGKAVDDNLKGPGHGAVAKNKKRIYRQYMNRKGLLDFHDSLRFAFITAYMYFLGGFNRPLQKIA